MLRAFWRRYPAPVARGLRPIGVGALLVVLAGCLAYPTSLPKPGGAATIRYRDPVFSATTITHDLTYGSAPDTNGNPVALKLDLYQPSGDTATPRPVLIWAHGGSFCCGDKGSGIAPL